ncbi:lacI family transcriptional regulator [Planomonospora sphaerica]|uniref:LacI family transcriptional regulator n=1 Tax=Planomonospora sphaerica TaxID=161355 RepID=A0A161LGX0_9ACTN|nr:LacI family DNA-binding transcriptional regulator [Planomonospora sphaerica]GAT66734.1 lacI family transcriptional regulator [Planomonospora sphaerica]
MKRPTIDDIARRAGVSKGAVSFALNGRPGVSAETRDRILSIATELGWQPSSVARALSEGRADVLGLVVARPARTLGLEPFFMQLMSGIEAALSAASVGLLLQMTEDPQTETGIYRRWWAQRRVAGVILVDLRVDDPRVAVLEELGMPAVVVGGPEGAGRLPAVWSDDAEAIESVVEHLGALGHRRIARVAGPEVLRHTVVRTRAMEAAAAARGMESVTVHTDYGADAGADATLRLLRSRYRPTAVVYDNDVMAVAGTAAAQDAGIAVPERLSVVAWDDSALCRLTRPHLTAVSRDIAAFGARAAQSLLDLVAGAEVGSCRDATPRLVVRGSTAPPAG